MFLGEWLGDRVLEDVLSWAIAFWVLVDWAISFWCEWLGDRVLGEWLGDRVLVC